MKNDEKILRKIAVIPAYNEQETICFVIDDIRKNVSDIDIVVIDDGSSDDTYVRAKAKRVFVIHHPYNMGIGAAVQTGFKFSKLRHYDVAIQVDGDGQHDPKYIPKMIELIRSGQADVVSGSRFLTPEGFKSSLFRRLGIKFFRILYHVLIGVDVTDCTSGFRAFAGRALELVAEDYPDDYPEPEVVIAIHKAKLKFLEIPVTMRSRQGGVSSIKGLKPLHYMIKVTLALLMSAIRKSGR